MAQIGRIVGKLLLILVAVKLGIFLFQYFILKSVEFDEFLTKVVLLGIPTEVSIVEKLAPVPIVMLIVLYWYIKCVK